jgi:hypothetical protein
MIILIFAIFTFIPLCLAEGLDSLIEVGKAQTDIQKSYSEETAAYNAVKQALAKGEIRKGQTNSDILSRYGQPVVMVKEYGTERDKWVYKPAKSTFFEGAKIALLFDKNGILEDINIQN